MAKRMQKEFFSVIKAHVDKIWDKYDKDKGGFLDKKEVEDLISEMMKESNKDADFSYDEFDILFADFDKNSDRKISKDEMSIFLLEMCGFTSGDLEDLNDTDSDEEEEEEEDDDSDSEKEKEESED